jgi:hypothetical protein
MRVTIKDNLMTIASGDFQELLQATNEALSSGFSLVGYGTQKLTFLRIPYKTLMVFMFAKLPPQMSPQVNEVSLEDQLREALKVEDYNTAAKLRDLLNGSIDGRTKNRG